jgi:hypothetical protein
MKGGSVASDNVVSLVSPGAFEKLDAQFDNQFGGKRKSVKSVKSVKSAKSVKPAAKAKSQGKKESKHLKGGMCQMCGGYMKHMNDFNDEQIASLYNKKGGANAPLFDIKYDYSTSLHQPAHGASIDRTLNETAINAMASESPSSLGGLQKSVQFGNVFGNNDLPFAYGGSRPKRATAKKDAAKPKAKKPASKKETTRKASTKAPSKK